MDSAHHWLFMYHNNIKCPLTYGWYRSLDQGGMQNTLMLSYHVMAAMMWTRQLQKTIGFPTSRRWCGACSGIHDLVHVWHFRTSVAIILLRVGRFQFAPNQDLSGTLLFLAHKKFPQDISNATCYFTTLTFCHGFVLSNTVCSRFGCALFLLPLYRSVTARKT